MDRKLGYIRSQAKDDWFDVQKEQLRLSGCVLIYRDIASQFKDERPGFVDLVSSLKKGDMVVNIASMPAQEKGMTNMMKVSKIK